MKDRIGFIGVGQGGSNIAKLFEENNYNTLYINTALQDLEYIKSNNKFHIPNSKGCGKDREKATEYAFKYYEKIDLLVKETFINEDIIFVVFSLGGGTGSGISPILLEILSSKNQDKSFGGIAILPELNDSIKAKHNAIESYNELIENKYMKSIFLIDNNFYKEYENTNKEFFNIFNTMIDLTSNSNKDGNIDEADLEKIITEKGYIYITRITDRKKNIENEEVNLVFQENPLVEPESNCTYMGLSRNIDINIKSIEKKYGKPIDHFLGFNKNENILVLSGIDFPIKPIAKLKERIIEDTKHFRKEDNKIKIEPPKIPKNKVEIEKIDFNDILNKYKRK